MFKRLFFLSGIIALLLAVLAMWFWYLPNNSPDSKEDMNPTAVDTVAVQDTTTMK